jgi:hypothetical protein
VLTRIRIAVLIASESDDVKAAQNETLTEGWFFR